MSKGFQVGRLAKPLRILIAAILLFLANRAFNAGAQTLTILWSFSGNSGASGLMQGSDGNFYGTAENGGTAFKISPAGILTNFYDFSGSNGVPAAGLIQGNDGNFYGTTSTGGTSTNCTVGLTNYLGCGTVFRISPSGSYTNLHSFGVSPNDGAVPEAGLVQGNDGNFYGTTWTGGTSGNGIVFRISPDGSYTNLHSFSSPPNDGAHPTAELVQGTDGNFYGTTAYGGTTNICPLGCGTVFRISPGGGYTNLYFFVGPFTDGAEPRTGLVQGSDGNFYGTTSEGGTYNFGTVFRISPDGGYTNLFTCTETAAGLPNWLVQASDGNFYGISTYGGTNTGCIEGCGSIFQISPSGSETTLYSSVGSLPRLIGSTARLVQGSDGNFYGTTLQGGTYSNGTVYKFSVPLNPPANQISAIQKSATNFVFTIPSVAGESYQLQYTDDPASGIWSNVPGASVTNSIGALMTLTNVAGASPQGFYRFAITP